MRNFARVLCFVGALFVVGFHCTVEAMAQGEVPTAFENCSLRSTANSTVSGRFIWKPAGAHFNRVVVVEPRYYYRNSSIVEIFTEDGRKVEQARLKSDGLCRGHPECLFAKTFLFRNSGAYYQRKFGKVFVRIRAARASSGLGCRYYPVNRPSRRAEYRG